MIPSPSNYRKRIPYGMSNFASVRERDCYFVDKTVFIPELEKANSFFFFIRPRRFGKSLTLSMLKHYYDINRADKFDKLFGGLYIGEHPTEERNSYLIISLNFSVIDGTLGNYKKSMDAHCGIHFESFCDVYSHLLPEGILERLKSKDGAVEQLQLLIDECAKVGRKIYLFIDEYDHFTNDILADPARLKDYESETHGEGYFRNFFNTVKAGTDSAIERCFVTGVSPVTMDDVTSGFNIGTNYSLSPEFNGLMGFTEEDVRQMLDYYRTTCEFHHTTDELIEGM
ncbi:MAG: AAA family ATPase, partial [Bacteroidaceae bacterium]|nr:AAA family ATPase [Bacteroidaceae bacterium]